MRFAEKRSPFKHSQCFDIKTAYSIKANKPIAESGRSSILRSMLAPKRAHTHHARDDAKEQAEIFANLMEWEG